MQRPVMLWNRPDPASLVVMSLVSKMKAHLPPPVSNPAGDVPASVYVTVNVPCLGRSADHPPSGKTASKAGSTRAAIGDHRDLHGKARVFIILSFFGH